MKRIESFNMLLNAEITKRAKLWKTFLIHCANTRADSMELQFEFDTILFFGRAVDEYRTMFNFEPKEWRGKRVLDCAAGPAALAASSPEWEIDCTACDPMYQKDTAALAVQADEDAEKVRALQAKTMDLFDEAVIRANIRREAMNVFLRDFEEGKKKRRYVTASLPSLPFADRSFDLTLCGNLLFLYSDTASGGMMPNSPLDYDFHLRSLIELARVTRGEVRIYPLTGPHATTHAYVQRAMPELQARGIECELVPVKHQDIKTALHLLSLRPSANQPK